MLVLSVSETGTNHGGETMQLTYLEHKCGHLSLIETDYARTGEDKIEKTSKICMECRQSRIGETVSFLRFGAAPEVSFNYRDNTQEDGVSVYEIVNGVADLVGFYFDFLDRPAYQGTGVITGWGSDGEPLVEIHEIKKIRKPQVKKLLPR